ncbi:hypothetical protein [Amycolatopsis saalfeldensis]|uniref:Uncharacterized protein n=1 Tax=Amycolatopsis saalfeldensis TaxID=394193 RepID=A0A1H8YAW3_9PSEU|nr:hypothetical protein [Amycolatopsis saalfeldensis]SEP48618.1 hypothetical protein SAMN04489732_11288 [Amycolatopsis saalfeldensis]
MTRARRFLKSGFGLVTLACLVLAGWATWSAGVFDGPLARQLRSSPVYAAPGQHVDLAAAERVVGNRRLVIGFLDGGTDLAAACRTLSNAAPDTIAVLLSPKTDDFDHYTCSRFPGAYDANFGKSFVAESKITNGIGGFSKQPLNAVKTIVVNYDQLVLSSTIPDGSRTINPSLPRYLIAIAALAAVIAGAAALYFGARRAAVATEANRIRRVESDDEKATLSSSAAVLAQEIINLDGRYAHAAPRGSFASKYRQLASDYANLLPQLDKDDSRLHTRVEELLTRSRKLTGK